MIRVTGSDDLRPGVLVKELVANLGTSAFFATRPASEAIMAIQYAGDLGDVTKHINWGKVTSTDADRRLIFVDAAGGPANN